MGRTVARRREVFGYCMFDFANSSYTTLISTVAYSVYFSQAVVPGGGPRGDFLWSNDMAEPPVRDRSGLPATTRKLEMVSDEELAEAVCIVVGRSYGISGEQAPTRVFKLLGYSRTTEAMKSRFDTVVGGLLSEGRLQEDGGLLVLAAPSET